MRPGISPAAPILMLTEEAMPIVLTTYYKPGGIGVRASGMSVTTRGQETPPKPGGWGPGGQPRQS